VVWSAVVSLIAEIAVFVSLADGALAPEVQIRAIRTRWPDATGEEICEAMTRSATGRNDDPEAVVALGVAVAAILGSAPRKHFIKPNEPVRAPFTRHAKAQTHLTRASP
jgi:hypothetical protein